MAQPTAKELRSIMLKSNSVFHKSYPAPYSGNIKCVFGYYDDGLIMRDRRKSPYSEESRLMTKIWTIVAWRFTVIHYSRCIDLTTFPTVSMRHKYLKKNGDRT